MRSPAPAPASPGHPQSWTQLLSAPLLPHSHTRASCPRMGAERDGDSGAWGTAPYSGSLVASPTFFGHTHLAACDKVGENQFLQKPNTRFQEDRLPLTPKHEMLGLEVGPARQWPTPYTHRQDCDVNTDIYLRPPVSGSVCMRKACT